MPEVEYQVPTSSQRDQDDDVIEIDDEREATIDVAIQEATLQDTYAEGNYYCLSVLL